MATSADDDKATTAYFDPSWIAMNGGWIHANNVLFYFAQSPFFDRSSANQSVITQNSGIPEREYLVLSTRKKFEENVYLTAGIQYLVEYDPLEMKTMINGPQGPEPSNIWIIRKQYRSAGSSDDEISVLGFYYILNDVIYQAPSLANILSYRMLNTITSLEKVFSTTSSLPLFSASHGHTYIKPAQKGTAQSGDIAGRTTKENTPMPDSQATKVDKYLEKNQANGQTALDDRTLREALNLTMRHGQEYMDENPLIGEPGSFRFSKIKELHQASKIQDPLTRTATISKVSSPAPTRNAPQTPSGEVRPVHKTLDNDPEKAAITSSNKSPTVPDSVKLKRRKSKAINIPE